MIDKVASKQRQFCLFLQTRPQRIVPPSKSPQCAVLGWKKPVLKAHCVHRASRSSLVTAALTTAEPATSRIGFIGLGIMGYPMALNLLKAGFSLTVWNRTAEKCDDLAAGGAAVAQTPAEVAANSDLIIAMLADPEACLAVTTGGYLKFEKMMLRLFFPCIFLLLSGSMKQLSSSVGRSKRHSRRFRSRKRIR